MPCTVWYLIIAMLGETANSNHFHPKLWNYLHEKEEKINKFGNTTSGIKILKGDAYFFGFMFAFCQWKITFYQQILQVYHLP